MTRDALVFCWDADLSRWVWLAVSRWIDFRRVNSGWRRIPEVSGGEFQFVVCVFDGSRTISNIVPFRYLVDEDGRIASSRFDDLNDAEVDRCDHLIAKHDPTVEEKSDLHGLQERQWLATLPTAQAAEALMHTLSRFRIAKSGPATRFLAAFDLESRLPIAERRVDVNLDEKTKTSDGGPFSDGSARTFVSCNQAARSADATKQST